MLIVEIKGEVFINQDGLKIGIAIGGAIMRRKSILIIMLLVFSVFVVGCGSDDKMTDRTVASSPSDSEPTIDRSYNTKSSGTTRTTTTTTNTLSGEERAKEVATDYIKKLDGYRSYNGRSLKFLTISNTGGDGNYVIDARFWRDATMSDYATEEPINVHLSIKKWKGDSYTFN